MGTIYHARTEYGRDEDGHEVSADGLAAWYVYCDRCESFNLVPIGYRKVITREITVDTWLFGRKVKKYVDICNREFRCTDCGNSIVIELDQIKIKERGTSARIARLRSKLSVNQDKYRAEKSKYQDELKRKNPRYDVNRFFTVGFDLEFRKKTGIIFVRNYTESELTSGCEYARKHW